MTRSATKILLILSPGKTVDDLMNAHHHELITTHHLRRRRRTAQLPPPILPFPEPRQRRNENLDAQNEKPDNDNTIIQYDVRGYSTWIWTPILFILLFFLCFVMYVFALTCNDIHSNV